MILPFRVMIIVFALLTGVITSYSVFAEEVYDRLDGTGPSHKRVDVIEWEGNLEIHEYPKGSNKGLSAKLDDRTEGKKVLVIGYRFNEKDPPLVRRAILGVPFNANVKGFIDPTEKEFDKLAISNQNLPAPWKPYKLDPAPKQWYPDGDERNEDEAAPSGKYLGEMKRGGDSKDAPSDSGRAPASVQAPERAKASSQKVRDEGSTNNFNW